MHVRAPCTPSPNGMHHRITLIELHQCTKFGVESSKFPKTGGPFSNKLIRSWRTRFTPLPFSVHHRITPLEHWNFIGVPISKSLAKVFLEQRTPSVHVLCTCTFHHNTSSRAPCISMPSFASAGQSFPKIKALMHMHSARAHMHPITKWHTPSNYAY